MVRYFLIFSIVVKEIKGWDQEKEYSEGKKVENIEDLFLEYVRIDQRD